MTFLTCFNFFMTFVLHNNHKVFLLIASLIEFLSAFYRFWISTDETVILLPDFTAMSNNCWIHAHFGGTGKLEDMEGNSCTTACQLGKHKQSVIGRMSSNYAFKLCFESIGVFDGYKPTELLGINYWIPVEFLLTKRGTIFKARTLIEKTAWVSRDFLLA